MWKFLRSRFSRFCFFCENYPHVKIKPICLYEGNRSSIIKITPTWNILPTFSRNFPLAKITTFTLYIDRNSPCFRHQYLGYRSRVGEAEYIPVSCKSVWGGFWVLLFSLTGRTNSVISSYGAVSAENCPQNSRRQAVCRQRFVHFLTVET